MNSLFVKERGINKSHKIKAVIFVSKSFKKSVHSGVTDLFFKVFRNKKDKLRCAFYYALVPKKKIFNSNFFILHFLFFIILLFSCENDLAQVNRLVNKNEITVETAKEIEMLYSDSAIVRVKVTGPTLLRHLDKRDPHQEFPDGIDVEFYGERGGVSSHMTAKYAMRFEKENKIVVRDSVVWISHDNERLETEELIWEEEEDKVYTNKFVTIFRQEEIIYGHGFESNQEFTEWTINAIQGRVKVENVSKE